jgi:hypothetical protein
MCIMNTSYYSKSATHPNAVSIAGKAPEWYDSGELTNDMFYSVMKDLETCLWEFYNES